MSKMFIIQESAVPSRIELLKKNDEILEFSAILQKANEKNRNGRVYPRRVLDEAISAPYIQERLRTKSLFCECGHPGDSSVQRQMTIDVRNAVCLIKELYWDGELLKGRCETLNTILGRDFKGILEQGSIAGFSLRAQGNVQPDLSNGGLVVQSPITICTWDYVVNPSHSGAFLERIEEETYNSLIKPNMYSSKQVALTEAARIYEEGTLIQIKEEPKQMIDYRKTFNKDVKLVNEMYIPEENEKFISLTEDKKAVILETEKTQKKVFLEDYLLKDIRKKIRGLK